MRLTSRQHAETVTSTGCPALACAGYWEGTLISAKSPVSLQCAYTVARHPASLAWAKQTTPSPRQIGHRVWLHPAATREDVFLARAMAQAQTHSLSGWWGYISSRHAAGRMLRLNKETQQVWGLKDNTVTIWSRYVMLYHFEYQVI